MRCEIFLQEWALDGGVLGLAPAIPSLVVFDIWLHFLLALSKGPDLLDFGQHQKNPICLHIPLMTLAMVGWPRVSTLLIVPLPWHGDQIQQIMLSYILDKPSQIIYGGSSWSRISEVIGSQPLTKKQSRLLQYLPRDVGTHNPHEFLFNWFEQRVV